MDNQLAQSPTWFNRLLVIAISIVLIGGFSALGIYRQVTLDPYISEVLSLEGDSQKGLAIFQINCAGCHNLQKDKNVGPRLENISKRKSPKDTIIQVISGNTPPMPKFQPSQQEMADLLSYLSKL